MESQKNCRVKLVRESFCVWEEAKKKLLINKEGRARLSIFEALSNYALIPFQGVLSFKMSCEGFMYGDV